MKFEMSKKSYKQYCDWSKEHDKKCPYLHTGAAGGRTSFCFTPTGIGIEIKVHCTCGANIDVTDTSEW